MFISNLGKMNTLKDHQIPESSRTSKGTTIVNILKLGGDEKNCSWNRLQNLH